MIRGIEKILEGRDPREAWAFAQRACGVCTTVHSFASIRSVEDALGIKIPKAANLIRNLMIAQQYVHDHVMHFYHLHAGCCFMSQSFSGTGAAQVEDMLILVGNFIQDFNYEMMSKCIRVPDEKFRDKVYDTMYENLTTILRETGAIPANMDIAEELAGRYSPLVGELIQKQKPDKELTEKADSLLAEMNTPEWLMANDRRIDLSEVKIAEGIYVFQKILKTPGGLIRVTAVNREGRLNNVHISGDFFFSPANILFNLEKALENVPAETSAISEVVTKFYNQFSVESPGLVPNDFGQVFTG